MEEPSDRQVELFEVHPAKRLTLVVLRIVFCMSIAAAVSAQFAGAKVRFFTPPFDFGSATNRAAVTLIIRPPTFGEWRLWYESNSYVNPGIEHTGLERFADFYESIVPGLYFNLRRPAWRMYVSHFWLIGISAVLCLFSRWRIRRSARLHKSPS